jgi:hypothetical protein
MASVEEVYQGYGVVHTADCQICTFEGEEDGQKHSNRVVAFVMRVLNLRSMA